MAKNDIYLIDGIIDERVNRAFPSSDRGEVFELFSAEQILKDYTLSTEDLLSCSVDGQNDGGIDFIFIFLNGALVQNIEDISIPKRNALLEIYIITCKHSDSFLLFAYYAPRPGPDVICLLTYLRSHITFGIVSVCHIKNTHCGWLDFPRFRLFFMFFNVSIAQAS